MKNAALFRDRGLWLWVCLGLVVGTYLPHGSSLRAASEQRPPVPVPHLTAALRPLGSSRAPVAKALDSSGTAVYKAQYCGLCHRFARAGTGGNFGPPHDGLAATASERIQSESYTGAATTAAEYVRESIVDPDVYVVPGYASAWSRMPAYKDLTPEELEALVHLLLEGE